MRLPRRTMLLWLSASLAILLAATIACSRNSTAPGVALQRLPGLNAALTAPSTLLQPDLPHRASYFEADLFKNGADYDPALPFANAAVDDTRVNLTPNSIPGAGLTGAAYCTYNFSITGYDRNPQVRLDWSTLTGPGQVWLGFANWGKDRWDWFNTNGEPKYNIQGFDSYIRADGRLLLVVLSLGSAQVSLSTLRIGSAPPVAALSVAPLAGLVPFDAAPDASASTDSDGAIAKYEWDLNGNGIFELDTGTDPIAPVQHFTSAGTTSVAVRVTDDDGLATSIQAKVTAFASWVHSWGGANGEFLTSAAFDGEGAYYFAGSTYSFSAGASDILLLKYNLAGELQWARTWGTVNYDDTMDLALDGAGNVVIAGYTDQSPQTLMLQVWSPAGELLRSRIIHAPGTLVTGGLVVRGTAAYICGVVYVASVQKFMLAKIELNGGVEWLKAWSAGTSLQLSDMGLYESLSINGSRLYSVGSADDRAAIVICDPDGNNVSAATLNSPNSSFASSVLVSGFNFPSVMVTGALHNGTLRAAFYAEYKLANPRSAIWAATSNDSFVFSIAPRPGGGFILAGDNFSTGTNEFGTLYAFSGADSIDSTFKLTSTSDGSSLSGGLQSLYGVALLSCGRSPAADEAAWAPLPGQSDPTPLGWDPLTLTEIDPGVITEQEFVGTLGVPSGAVLDTGAGGDDVLMLVRGMP